MMESIRLQSVCPTIFQSLDLSASDVWRKNLSFRKGEHYLLEAASGTGKSSLCSYLYGYRHDYEGLITFDEKEIRSLKVKEWTKIRKTSISILFQDMRLFPELTAFENVQIKNRLTHYQTKKTIFSFFERLGIQDKLNSKVELLSFGQQQRVAFIRALCQPFDFILLDEPISHLDDVNAMIISELLLEEIQKTGAGILVTSIGKHLPLTYNQTLVL